MQRKDVGVKEAQEIITKKKIRWNLVVLAKQNESLVVCPIPYDILLTIRSAIGWNTKKKCTVYYFFLGISAIRLNYF